jgi:peptidylprolyl isomerase
MTRRILAAACVVMCAAVAGASARQTPEAPVVVFETVKGTIEFRLYPADAPRSVEHVLTLVRKHFYRGLRFHRVERSLAQIGDPATRDMTRRAYWGRGGSGTAVGVAEFSRRSHGRGAVGLAHAGNAEHADSQIYFLKAPNPALDGKHVVIGQITAGLDVLDRIEEADRVKVAYVKGEGRPF